MTRAVGRRGAVSGRGRGGKVVAGRGKKVVAGRGRGRTGRVARGRGRGKKAAPPNKDALDKELDTFMQER